MCFLDCFIQVKIHQSIRMTIYLYTAQDMMFGVSDRKKHMGLALSIHQATRSKELVYLLNAAGHCVRYDMIRRMQKINRRS